MAELGGTARIGLLVTVVCDSCIAVDVCAALKFKLASTVTFHPVCPFGVETQNFAVFCMSQKVICNVG